MFTFFGKPHNECQSCGKPLVAFEWEAVEIDRCAACGGTWLDAGEIERIAAMAGILEAGAGELSRALAEAARDARSERSCPRCGRRLQQVKVGEEAPVEIDRCPKGHGFWFDAGEMRALVERFSGGEAGAVARFFAEMFRSEVGGE